MKITIESTTKIIEANGVACRVWEGETDTGIKVTCLIPRIAVKEGENVAQFKSELRECRAPSAELNAWPLRMIL